MWIEDCSYPYPTHTPLRVYQSPAGRLASLPEFLPSTAEDRSILTSAIQKTFEEAGISMTVAQKEMWQNLLNSSTTSSSFRVPVIISCAHQPAFLNGPLMILHKILWTSAFARALQQIFPTLPVVAICWIHSDDHDWYELIPIRLHRQTWKPFDLFLANPAIQFCKTPPGWLPVPQTLAEKFNTLLKQQRFSPSLREGIQEHPWLKPWLAPPSEWRKDPRGFVRAFISSLQQITGFTGILWVEAHQVRQSSPDTLQTLFRQFAEHYSALLSQLQEHHHHLRKQGVEFFHFDHPARRTWFFQLHFPDNSRFPVRIPLPFPSFPASGKANHLSPGALVRPLWQERILHSLFFTGGPSEIGYWLEIFPWLQNLVFSSRKFFLQLRHPVVWIPEILSTLWNHPVFQDAFLRWKEDLLWRDFLHRSTHRVLQQFSLFLYAKLFHECPGEGLSRLWHHLLAEFPFFPALTDTSPSWNRWFSLLTREILHRGIQKHLSSLSSETWNWLSGTAERRISFVDWMLAHPTFLISPDRAQILLHDIFLFWTRKITAWLRKNLSSPSRMPERTWIMQISSSLP